MIEFYQHDRHFHLLRTWLADKQMSLEDSSFLSDTGFVVEESAIGFLYTTNSTQCWIDNIAANPNVTKEKRDGSLYILLNRLIQEAEQSGYHFIHIMSSSETMKQRINLLGFTNAGEYTAFCKLV